MIVEFYLKTIERYHAPENPKTHNKIKDIKKKLLLKLHTSHIPDLTEVINIDGAKYEVIKKIRMIDYVVNNEADEEYFIIEVTPYSETVTKKSGTDSWTEYIPLVCDITD